jgi:hypothetical protein
LSGPAFRPDIRQERSQVEHGWIVGYQRKRVKWAGEKRGRGFSGPPIASEQAGQPHDGYEQASHEEDEVNDRKAAGQNADEPDRSRPSPATQVISAAVLGHRGFEGGVEDVIFSKPKKSFARQSRPHRRGGRKM